MWPQMGGPMWTAPIHDAAVLAWVRAELTAHRDAFGSYKRLFGAVTAMAEVRLLEGASVGRRGDRRGRSCPTRPSTTRCTACVRCCTARRRPCTSSGAPFAGPCATVRSDAGGRQVGAAERRVPRQLLAHRPPGHQDRRAGRGCVGHHACGRRHAGAQGTPAPCRVSPAKLTPVVAAVAAARFARCRHPCQASQVRACARGRGGGRWADEWLAGAGLWRISRSTRRPRCRTRCPSLCPTPPSIGAPRPAPAAPPASTSGPLHTRTHTRVGTLATDDRRPQRRWHARVGAQAAPCAAHAVSAVEEGGRVLQGRQVHLPARQSGRRRRGAPPAWLLRRRADVRRRRLRNEHIVWWRWASTVRYSVSADRSLTVSCRGPVGSDSGCGTVRAGRRRCCCCCGCGGCS
jgi:hypothetical protein